MRFRKLSAALLVSAALSFVFAGSAFGAATTEDVKWYLGSPGTVLSGSQTIKAAPFGSVTFATSVSGLEVVLQASGIECVGCKIENIGGTAAVGSGQLKFTGVSVKSPAKCSTSS